MTEALRLAVLELIQSKEFIRCVNKAYKIVDRRPLGGPSDHADACTLLAKTTAGFVAGIVVQALDPAGFKNISEGFGMIFTNTMLDMLEDKGEAQSPPPSTH